MHKASKTRFMGHRIGHKNVIAQTLCFRGVCDWTSPMARQAFHKRQLTFKDIFFYEKIFSVLKRNYVPTILSCLSNARNLNAVKHHGHTRTSLSQLVTCNHRKGSTDYIDEKLAVF